MPPMLSTSTAAPGRPNRAWWKAAPAVRPGHRRPRRGCGSRPPRQCRCARPARPGCSVAGCSPCRRIPGAMAHGLAVGADGPHGAGGDAAALPAGVHTCGIHGASALRGQRGAVQFVVARVLRASISARTRRSKGAGVVQCQTTRAGPEKSASTPSTPSSEVPDIRPMYSSAMPGAAWGGAYWALACWTERGRRQLQRACWRPGGRTRAGRRRDGAAASLWRAMVIGSWCWPLTRNSKCRCGPVAQPVAPTAPMFWPCSTDWPFFTDAAQVGVHGDVLVAVLHEDHVAKAVLHAGKLDHAVAHRAHGVPVGAA
jgi:hypothetical protein